MKSKLFCFVLLAIVSWAAGLSADEPKTPDYRKEIAPIFRKYCNGCHNAKEAEGELVLDNFPKLMQGGENGKIVVPGKPDKSRLILVLEKKVEPFMPPEDNKAPTAKEIELAKILIEKGLITPAEFMQKLSAERARARGIWEKFGSGAQELSFMELTRT